MKLFFVLFLFMLAAPVQAAEIPPVLADIQAAPEITQTSVPDLMVVGADGADFNATRTPAKITLLNFWATWCGPCVKELPGLNTLQRQFDTSELLVVPVSMDRKFDQAARDKFARRVRLPDLDLYWDKARMANVMMGLKGVPTSFLLDGEGNVLGRFEGDAPWDDPDITAYIDGLIHPTPSPTIAPADLR